MKDKILDLLLHNAGSCMSGQQISRMLNISRTAVWKHIKTLQDQGYPIQSIDRKGYQLSVGESYFTVDDLKKRLDTKWIGRKIIVLPRVDSTNLYARKLKDKLSHGDIVVAEEQTKGKGRQGKSWSSPRGDGIWVTIFLRPSFSIEKAAFITQLAAAAMWHSIKKNTDLETKVKWPNDLLIGEKKVSGILTELAGELSQIDFMLVGVGLNVNTDFFPEEIKDTATSLKRITGKKLDRTKLLTNFLEQFEVYYDEICHNATSENALGIIRQHSSVLNKWIYITRYGQRIEAKAVNILDNGALEVEHKDKTREILSGGEISVRTCRENNG
ncbi:biotin--[acetyl-CoA-carboxylase] ligase [Tindallia californiensis]|uniref:Bifunctional ligase/repressor BirA n=1 Tax=Tindallia californiensis TaxID=159292 RepID=A0A1H3L0L9_9FIRM|nr:biotin--[acetyl-CoA-carboxylase] ligase [Tindallia californiensis]SDY57941.1 BirA family transcriptional regulator, biotin operon repressor / biotin-[acetyl-CoA-carboxylase] ligase [Tindallia californiensis]